MNDTTVLHMDGNFFTINSWAHVAVTYDRATGGARVYRNGAVILESNVGQVTVNTSLPLTFGSSLKDGNYFNGLLDEITLYGRPLNGSEVSAIYAAGAVGKEQVDDNQAPMVSAGPDLSVSGVGSTLSLAGVVYDDGKPLGATSAQWTKLDGPGSVTFGNATSATTTATVSAAGTYVLQLSVSDGAKSAADTMVARVGVTGLLASPSGLAAWWPANGDGNEVVHGGHSALLYGGATFAPGQVSEAFSFDGSFGQVQIGASSDLDVGTSNAGLSVEFWAKPTRSQDNQMLIAWGTSSANGVRIVQYFNGNGIYVYLTDTAGTDHLLSVSGGFFTINAWTHVAVTYDHTTGLCSLYRNGTLFSSSNLGIFTPQTSLPMSFGAYRNNNFYAGLLDEVSLYNRPLSANEVSSLYQAGGSGKTPVAANILPVVLLQSPASRDSAAANTAVTLTATAFDSDGTIAGVNFYDGATKLGTTTAAVSGQPTTYSFNVSAGFATGLHVITAKATDNAGGVTTSGVVYLNVLSAMPAVAITAPASGSSILAGSSLSIATTATYANGVGQVEVFDGDVRLGVVTAPDSNNPAKFTLTLPGGLAVGTHVLRSKATGSDGAYAFSPVISLVSGTNAGPTLTNLTFNGVAAPTSIQGNGTFGITAVDPDGVKHVQFVLDGQLLVDDTTPGDGFTALFTLRSVPLGSHTLTVQGWDIYDAASAVTTFTFTSSLPPPPAAPASLTATAVSSNQITLGWQVDLSTGVVVELERKAGASGTYAHLADVLGSAYFDTIPDPSTSYFYRVRARDTVGQTSAYSNEVTVTSLSATAPALPTASVRLWLNADAGLAPGKIASWPDQSGAAQNAVQSVAAAQPTMVQNGMSGHSTVRFDGVASYLTLPNFMNAIGAGEVFVVLRARVVPSNGSRTPWSFGTSFGAAYPNASKLTDDFGSTVQWDLGVPTQDLTQFHLYNASSQANDWVARLDGTVLFRSSTNTVGFRSNPMLGRTPQYTDTNFFDGDIAELLVFDHVLSASEQQAVENYLYSRYGIAVPAPVISPAAGAYSAPVSVSLASASPGMSLYYTTDGSVPTVTQGTLYAGPFTVSQSTRVRAIAVANSIASPYAESVFGIGVPPTPATPTSGLTGTYFQGSNFDGTSNVRLDPVVDFPNASSGAKVAATSRSVRWTGSLVAQYSDTYTFWIKSDGAPKVWIGNALVIDGSAQTSYQEMSGTAALQAGQSYPVRIDYVVRNSDSTTDRVTFSWSSLAVAKQAVPTNQLISGLSYANTVTTPVPTPSAGTFGASASVTLTAAPSNARIYYTLTGDDPTEASPLYAGPIAISQTATLRSRAFATGYNPSGLVVATYTLDNSGPTLSNVTFNGQPVPNPITISGSFGVTATALSGVKHVSFALDGQVLADDTVATDGFTAPFSIGSVTDGPHTLTIQAWNTFDIASSVMTVPVTVAMASPPAPVIASPANGQKFNQPSVTLRGSAQPAATITVRRDTSNVATGVAGPDGTFAIDVSLAVGANSFTAIAANRNPNPSAPSGLVQLTYDNTVPNPPTAVTATPRAGGTIELNWFSPASGLGSGYYVFRSTQPIPDYATFNPSQALGGAVVRGLRYLDTPPSEGHYYYRVVTVYAVGDGVTLSALSNQTDAVSDSTAPTATVSLLSVSGHYDALNNRFGPGIVQATVTTSEQLGATPFLNLSVANGAAVFVNLTASGPNTYVGSFAIDTNTASGTVGVVFSAIDLAGNRGSSATLTKPAIFDTAGPRTVGLAPVSVSSTGTISAVSIFTDIKNDPVAPATSVTVSWVFTLDEAPKPGAIPVIGATLSLHPGTTLQPTVTDGGDNDPHTWLAQFTLPADAGTSPENLVLQITVPDDLDNVGQTIVPPHTFQVYRGNLPPLPVPTGLKAVALPAGGIQLSWQPVSGAAGYALQVQAPGSQSFTDLVTVNGTVTLYTYTPASDGSYSYQLASVRTENGQSSLSGYSSPVIATSDRIAPNAPTNLTLAVVGQGVRASWTSSGGDVAGYNLYSSNAAISDVTTLTPVVTKIPANASFAIDPQPTGARPYYAVVAYDAAGNLSAPVTGFANVGLLPVAQISVSQSDSAAPVLSWTPAAGGVLDGFNLTVDGAPITIGGNILIPTSTNTYSDSAYTGKDRRYGVISVSGSATVERDLTLPAVVVSLDPAAEIKHGLMDTLLVNVQNNSAGPVTDAVATVSVGGHMQMSAGLTTIQSGGSTAIPVVVGGFSDIATSQSTPVVATLVLNPNPGERVSIARTAQVKVTDGGLTAEILPGSLTRGGNGTVRFKLTNPSSSPIDFVCARHTGSQPSDQARIKITDLQGSLLSTTPWQLAVGDNVMAMPDGTTIVRVPANGVYTSPAINVPVPTSAPAQVDVVLEIDSVYYDFGGSGTQVQLPGPRAVAIASSLDTSYHAEVTSVSPVDSAGDQPIVIQGRAIWRGMDPNQPSALAPDVSVIVFVQVGSFIRQQTITTDATGVFSYVFTPNPNEPGGVYSTWATHPDATTPPTTPTTFTIERVLVSPTKILVNVPRNYRQQTPISVTAGPGTTAQNVRAQLVGTLPAAVSVDTAAVIASVAPSQTVTLPLSIVGLAATADATASGNLTFDIVSDTAGGPHTWATVAIHYQFTDAAPVLQADPPQLTVGVQPQQVSAASLTVTNAGYATADTITATLVGDGTNSVPDWVRLQTPASLGSLDIGAAQTVMLGVAPPATTSQVDQVYHLFVRLQAANLSAPLDVPVTITVSPAGKGGLLLHLVDPYFQLTLPNNGSNPNFNGVVGAAVSLEKESSTGIPTDSRSGSTDANGEIQFTDLPAGRYQLRVSADRHQPYSSRVTIQAGVTDTEQVQLTYSPVSFTWSVVPVTFQDRYDVVLTSTFETNVPVPVVVAEPSSISIPPMCAGQVLNGEIKMSNYGLIDAQALKIALPPSDQYFKYDLLPGTPDTIPAGQSTRLAYRITCLQALPGACDAATASTSTTQSSSVGKVTIRAMTIAGTVTARADSSSPNCGTYMSSLGVTWTATCANGQKTSGSSSVPCTGAIGHCTFVTGSWDNPAGWTDPMMYWVGGSKNPSQPTPQPPKGASGSGSGSACFPMPGPGGAGNAGGGGGNCTTCKCTSGDGGWPGGGSGAGTSPGGGPPPPNSMGTSMGGPDSAGGAAYSGSGSWVSLISRQYVDSIEDLKIPVAGGFVDLWREFKFSQWYFRIADPITALAYPANGVSTGGTVATLVLAGQEYKNIATNTSLVGSPSAVSVSSAPAGEYLYVGGGQQRIVKAADGTFTWTNGNGNQRTFAADGKLAQTKFFGRLVASFSYAADGTLSSISDQNGRVVLTLTYTSGRLTGATDVGNRTVSYTYDTNGRMQTATDAVGTVVTYTYDDYWHMTGRRTHLGGTADTADEIETIQYQTYSGAATGSPSSLVVAGHPALGEKIRGEVSKVSHNDGRSYNYTYSYDESNRIYYASVTSATGMLSESVFDNTGTLVSYSVNGVPVYKMQYTANSRAITRGGNETTTEDLDEQGNVTRRVNPDGSIEAFEYTTSFNRLAKSIDALGVVTTFSYDGSGNLLTKTEAFGTSLERTTTRQYYPGTNLLKLETDPMGHKMAYEYDGNDRLTHVYDPDNVAHQTTYTYDAVGNEITETDALSHTTTRGYDAARHVTSITDALNQQTITTYQGDNVTQIEVDRTANAAGLITRFTYDSAGRKITEKRVDDKGAAVLFNSYTYDSDGRLSSETNALGQSFTYTYDAAGNRATVTAPNADGAPSTTTTTYDVLNRPISVVDPVGNKKTITYDLRDRPSVVNEAVGTAIARSTTTTYDLAGHVVQVSLTDGSVPNRTYTTTYTYDVLGRRTAEGGNHVYARTLAYDAADRLATETDALGRITTRTYDAYGELTSIAVNGTAVTSWSYDAVGNVLSENDGEGNHRHQHYDALNRVLQMSVPMAASQVVADGWWSQPASILIERSYSRWGAVASETKYVVQGAQTTKEITTITFDAFGRKASDTDPAGLTRKYSYDAADNLLSVAYPPVSSSGATAGTTETYVRSPNNAALVTGTVDRSGNTTTVLFDGALRVRRQTSSLGANTDITYDALGRVATRTDPAGTTSFVYDLLDNPVKVTYPDHVAVTHERIAVMTYDTYGKLLTRTGAGDYPMSYAYDAVGNTSSMTDGNGHTTQWTYTARNQVSTKTYADATSATYTYDNANHLKTRKDGLGRTTTYTYGPYGLPSTVTYPTNPAVGFSYDQQGRRLTMSDGSGTTTWTYDSAGRVASETQSRSQRTLTFSYDTFGNRTSLVVSVVGNAAATPWTTGYGYDNGSRLVTVLDSRLPAAQPFIYSYSTNANLVAGIVSPTGLTTTKTYDSLGRLLSIGGKRADNSAINSFSYTYDAAGQRSTETALDYQQTFTYDPLRQLTQASPASVSSQRPNFQYGYDAIGNRATASADSGSGAAVSSYVTNTINQYTSITGASPDTPAYDANGNTTSLRGMTLKYDEENRLIEVDNGLNTSMYVYDALSRRVEKDDYVNGSLSSVTHEVYDGRRMIEEADGNGLTLRSYTRGLDLSVTEEGAGGIGGLLAFARPTGSSFSVACYFYDGNGNVTDLADDSGTSQAYYTYSPFGERLTASGSLAEINPFQFSSMERDGSSTFSYYGFRSFDSRAGRWLSRDPIQERGGMNVYGFVNNAPIGNFDYLGLDVFLYFWDSSQGASGSGHVGIGSGTTDQQQFFEANPDPSGMSEPMRQPYTQSGSLSQVLQKSADYVDFGQSPRLVLQFKTCPDEDRKVIEALKAWFASHSNWTLWDSNCADAAKCGLRSINISTPTNYTYSTPQELARHLLQKYGGTNQVTVVSGNWGQYAQDNGTYGVMNKKVVKPVRTGIQKAVSGVQDAASTVAGKFEVIVKSK